ncbi:MAG: hypothetical protein JEZ06_02140 [Anaerolineaceae bacterium]|nr:hypothetical protein [Anaerolineaceae bacterium]
MKSTIKTNGSYNRIGFHFFPDTLHYTEKDLKTWMPILKSIKAYWLVLPASFKRAVPERFIKGLINQNITPIIHLYMDLESSMDVSQVAPLIQSYAKWGVKYIILFDKPNCKSFYARQITSMKSPVEYFINQFVPLADLCIENNIKPVFPPLNPGGDYWDLTFLEASFGLLQTNNNHILQDLVISANSWTNSRDLDWGSGAGHSWPAARPYFTPDDQQDHLGFRVFEWYNEISQAILQKSCPIILLGSGIPGNPDQLIQRNEKQFDQAAISVHIGKLLTNKYLSSEENLEKIEPLPDYILCGNFWTLADERDNSTNDFSWVNTEENTKVLTEWLNWINENETSLNEEILKSAKRKRSVNPTDFHKYSTNDPKYVLSLMEQKDYQYNTKTEPQTKTVISPTDIQVQTRENLEKELEENGFCVEPLININSENIPEEKAIQSISEEIVPSPAQNSQVDQLSPQQTTQLFDQEKPEKTNSQSTDSENFTKSNKPFSRPIDHYLLLPSYEWGVADYHLDLIRPILKKHKPTMGFSLKEAALAKRITVVGTQQVYPDEILDKLKANGAEVDRIYGFGTQVASDSI